MIKDRSRVVDFDLSFFDRGSNLIHEVSAPGVCRSCRFADVGGEPKDVFRVLS